MKKLKEFLFKFDKNKCKVNRYYLNGKNNYIIPKSQMVKRLSIDEKLEKVKEGYYLYTDELYNYLGNLSDKQDGFYINNVDDYFYIEEVSDGVSYFVSDVNITMTKDNKNEYKTVLPL